MRLTVHWPAQPGVIFRPGAFRTGGVIPVVLYDDDEQPGPTIGAGTIIAADVAEDGRSVSITIDVAAEGPDIDAGPGVLRDVLRFGRSPGGADLEESAEQAESFVAGEPYSGPGSSN